MERVLFLGLDEKIEIKLFSNFFKLVGLGFKFKLIDIEVIFLYLICYKSIRGLRIISKGEK